MPGAEKTPRPIIRAQPGVGIRDLSVARRPTVGKSRSFLLDRLDEPVAMVSTEKRTI